MKVRKMFLETLLIVMVIFITSCGAQNNNTVNKENEVTSAKEFTFRKVNPYMSKEEVIKSEDTEPIHVGDTVGFRTTIAGLDCELYYNFEDDQCNGAIVFFREYHKNYENYVDDYYAMNDKLTAKYGEPTIDTGIWHDKEHMSDYKDEKGYAIANEWLTLSSTYTYDKMMIVHELKGNDYDIDHTLCYYFENYVTPDLQDEDDY